MTWPQLTSLAAFHTLTISPYSHSAFSKCLRRSTIPKATQGLYNRLSLPLALHIIQVPHSTPLICLISFFGSQLSLHSSQDTFPEFSSLTTKFYFHMTHTVMVVVLEEVTAFAQWAGGKGNVAKSSIPLSQWVWNTWYSIFSSTTYFSFVGCVMFYFSSCSVPWALRYFNNETMLS